MVIGEVLTVNIRDFNAPFLAQDVIKKNKLSELVIYALQTEKLLSSRASWIIAHCYIIDKLCLKPYFTKLILNLKHKNLHQGVVRNTLRIFQEQTVPKKHHIFMLNVCYKYLSDYNQSIAVRSFSIGVIYNISKTHPELLQELKCVLQLLTLNEESRGMKSKINNTLKSIQKI